MRQAVHVGQEGLVCLGSCGPGQKKKKNPVPRGWRLSLEFSHKVKIEIIELLGIVTA